MRDTGQDRSTRRFQNICPFSVYSARSGCMMSIVPLLCALMCPTASRSDLRIWFHRRKHPCRDSETIWLFRNCPWFWLAEPVRALVPFRCPLIPLAQLTSKIQVCAINGTNFFLIHSLCTLWECKLYGTPAFMLGMQVQYQPQILHIRTEKHTVEWKSIENYWMKNKRDWVPALALLILPHQHFQNCRIEIGKTIGLECTPGAVICP